VEKRRKKNKEKNEKTVSSGGIPKKGIETFKLSSPRLAALGEKKGTIYSGL